MNKKIEKYTENGWKRISIEELREGDVFSIWNFVDYKNTWEQYKDCKGHIEWQVIYGPYIHPIYNVWTIHAGRVHFVWEKSCPIILWDMEHLIYGKTNFYHGIVML